MHSSRRIAPLLVAVAFLFPGCGHRHRRVLEVAYVSAPQAFLRDHVAAVYNKTGAVKNGERVEVLDRDRRFVQVRAANGSEGWVEERYLVSQKVFDAFQTLAQQAQNKPVLSPGVTRNDTNLHVQPGRDTEHLYQVTQGAKVSLLERATAEKNLPGMPVAPSGEETPQSKPAPPLEDWWLVRDANSHVGWALGRMLDVDVPIDIAQYAEGQRIVAALVLNEVPDADKKVPQYLMLLTEPKDGLPFDYDQIRVFTWNVKRHRYETAYRERNLYGMLPVTVSQENFDKEGMLPVFVLHVKDDNGNMVERKYKLNTPIVSRVYAPGEQPPRPAARRRRR